ncbi:DNA polymerase III subunit alpha [Facklamia miroungae]|uniref:DNA polymerase III subunit alpha n=1 Tax=Facklamia miroungae TaxID=120956 RepID=A0A1G7PQ77_9LACT|nr:DNA polymerase III subunit alpha [Facklamia miroungae]NKZ28767.1 DNA polymerase III subunit alpha [Facklamia miroungae]SDF87590.1 DNA polymerase-3 subunit alpha [Facklamia miroungae]
MLFNVRSSYSLLQSTLDLDKYVERAKQLGYTHLGLADEGVLHGSLKFYLACQKANVQAMIGLTLNLPGRVDNSQNYPILVYALNDQGYLTLIQISKIINQSQPDYQKIDQLMRQAQQSLIIISPGKKGEMEQALLHENSRAGQAILEAWLSIFPKTNIYLGLSIYPYNELEVSWLSQFANNNQLTLVCNQLVESLTSEDGFAIRILQAIDSNEVLDPSIMTYRTSHYLYGLKELEDLYQQKGLDWVVANSHALEDRMQVELPINQSLLPKFQTPADQSAKDYLKGLCQANLKKLEGDQIANYQVRLDHELTIIDQMGFNDYFLIVWEIMAFCHSHAIRTGPGRGSAAGSLVAYLLGITKVDPIEYDLLFERFLNPERYNMPDIDIDIPDDKREQVLRYIEEKYGSQHVAQMITFGSFGAKQSLRDTLRVLSFPKIVQVRWSKTIPNEVSIQLKDAFQKSSALRDLIAEDPLNQQIFKTALTIEGLPRHTSTHASGVVIADQDLSRWIPVFSRENQMQITQFDMEDVERVGLLKMDFLGLKNLQILDQILKLIRKNQGQTIDIDRIDRNDPATLELFQRADTQGIFQFESEGIRQVLRRLKPEAFEDIIAVNALYRPGPMQQITHFIARKHGKEKIEYIHPLLEEILKKTYGIIVYQEQVMQICQKVAGFSLGQADLLRRAMGKKEIHLMEKQKSDFLAGCQARGLAPSTSQEIFHYIYQFANYGFNRAHAAVYSTLAYQLAYLKVHYPLEFFTAILNQGRSIHQSLDEYLSNAKRTLGKFLMVDINQSHSNFEIEDGKIRIGLMAIKGLRQDFCQAILDERNLAGPYTDFQNFLSRLPVKFLKNNLIQALIDAGALDTFGYTRATLTENLDRFIQFCKISGNHVNLLKEIEPKVSLEPEWPKAILLDRQREVLGLQLAGHPIDDYLKIIEADTSFHTIGSLKSAAKHKTVKILAYIENIKVIETKKKEKMAFYRLNDGSQSISLVSFPETYQRFGHQVKDGQVIALQGQVSIDRQGELQIVLDRLLPLPSNEDKPPLNKPQQVFLRIIADASSAELVEKVKKLAQKNPGPLEIIMVDTQRNAWKLDKAYNLSMAHRVVEELKNLFGEQNVYFK